MIVVAVALIALCASLPMTASVGDLGEAKNLLDLISLVNEGRQLTVDDVVDAYKDYKNLYTMQNNLAAGQQNPTGKSEYENISEVLATPGIENIVENLFTPLFNANSERLINKKRIKIQEAIDEMT